MIQLLLHYPVVPCSKHTLKFGVNLLSTFSLNNYLLTNVTSLNNQLALSRAFAKGSVNKDKKIMSKSINHVHKLQKCACRFGLHNSV